MNASASNHLETSVVALASLVKRHPRGRPASKLIKPTILDKNRCNADNLDNHNETQTTCPIGATRSRRHHTFSLGDLGHNDCFYRGISSCRRMGDRQEISFRHDLADLLSHNFTTHLLFWDFAGTNRILGRSGRNPTTPFRLLAGGLGNDGRHGIDHILHPTGSDFMVSDAHAPAVSSLRWRSKMGCIIHTGAGGAARHFLPINATADALTAVCPKQSPHPALEATP